MTDRDLLGDGMKTMRIELGLLVLAREESTATALKLALARVDSVNVAVERYSGITPLADLQRETMPDIVLLEIDGDLDAMLVDAQRFIEAHDQKTDLFVLLRKPDLQTVKKLMHAGVRDVLSLPVDVQELVDALSKSLSRSRQSLAKALFRRGAISAFINVKGGAGSQFLAQNIAYLLATRHARKTILVDLDLAHGTIASDLDVQSEATVMEALANPERIDPVFLDALKIRHGSGLDLLVSPGDLSSSSGISQAAVTRLVSTLARNYQHVVLSLPMCPSESMDQAARLANPLFLVTQETVPMLRNLKMMLKRLPLKGVPLLHIEVIRNRVGGPVKDISRQQFDELLGDRHAHAVRGDYKLAIRAENEGKALAELSPRAGITRELDAIAEYLVQFDPTAEQPARGGLLSWLHHD